MQKLEKMVCFGDQETVSYAWTLGMAGGGWSMTLTFFVTCTSVGCQEMSPLKAPFSLGLVVRHNTFSF